MLAPPITPIEPKPHERSPMPDINLREVVAPEVEKLLGDISLTEEQRAAIRKSIVDHFNRAVNIPVIGEHLEEILFTFVLKVLEKIALAYAGQLKDRILRAID